MLRGRKGGNRSTVADRSAIHQRSGAHIGYASESAANRRGRSTETASFDTQRPRPIDVLLGPVQTCAHTLSLLLGLNDQLLHHIIMRGYPMNTKASAGVFTVW